MLFVSFLIKLIAVKKVIQMPFRVGRDDEREELEKHVLCLMNSFVELHPSNNKMFKIIFDV